MNNLAKRTVVGLLGGALLIFLIVFGSYTFLGFMVLLNVLGLLEFYNIVGLKRNNVVVLLVVLSTIMVAGAYCSLENVILTKHWFLFTPLFFIVFLFQLFKSEASPVQKLGYYFLGFFYVTLPVIFCLNVAYFSGEYNYELILGMMLLISMNDVGAYFAGKSLGKNKLFERISPKKTWEGSIGGLITSLIVAYFLSMGFESLSVINWLAVAVLTTIFGGLGDLVESMMKRDLGIKDSGNLIPGHGGVLDRFDALLIAAPFVYFYLMLWEQL